MNQKITQQTTITRIQRDALKEVASLGAGSASNALSRLTNKTILVDFINIEFISPHEVPKLFTESNDISAVFLNVTGDLTGLMLFLSTQATSLELTKLVTEGKGIEATKEDILKEVSNILTGSYLAALADMTSLNILESIPTFKSGIIKDIMELAEKKMPDVSTAILLETVLLVGEEMKQNRTEILFMLSPDQLDKLFLLLFKEVK